MINIFEYQDYRAFLAAYYEQTKSVDPAFSYQHFSQALGFSSKGFLYEVIKGKKNLSAASLAGMRTGLGLGKTEGLYFENLIRFNQAKTFNEREAWFAKLRAVRAATADASKARMLHRDQYEFFSTWHHSVVRSLVDMYPNLSGDYTALAKLVHPALRPKQVQKSIGLLLRLGLLTPVKGGGYKIAEKRITTGEQVQSMAVLRFHLETMKLAEQALKELPHDKRNVSGLTLGISKDSCEKIVGLIYECQKKIMDVADNDTKADRVYQVDFQVFPVSKV
jgi:uncharacterized protein (TIGR02147 family)